MPIVIKEIRVTSVIEKKIIEPPDISEELLTRIREEVIAELKQESNDCQEVRKKNER